MSCNQSDRGVVMTSIESTLKDEQAHMDVDCIVLDECKEIIDHLCSKYSTMTEQERTVVDAMCELEEEFLARDDVYKLAVAFRMLLTVVEAQTTELQRLHQLGLSSSTMLAMRTAIERLSVCESVLGLASAAAATPEPEDIGVSVGQTLGSVPHGVQAYRCDGRLVLKEEAQKLWAAVGNAYRREDDADDSIYFRIPDRPGFFIVAELAT